MANTKFLDYNGLSKLVEKIKNTYVNKNEQYEANLKWGGGNFADSYGPIDAAMIPELGANRFAFGNPKGITVEYSNDGGNTWKDYGADPVSKGRLLSDGYPFIIGKVKSSTPANDMLRITIDTSTETGINCYTILNKFVIKISTQGSVGCYCTIQKALQSTPTKFLNVVSKVNINGWPGYNVINVPTITTYGNEENFQYGRLRFIFGSTGNDTSYSGLAIHNICAFGGVGWNIPSNMAENSHLYSYDYNQNAKFPAIVTATKFIGTLQGNANSASKLNIGTTGKSTKPVYFNNGVPATCTYELNKTVPSTAVFTDTKYTLSGDDTNKVTITDSNKSSQSITINNVQKAVVATYANQYLYDNSPRDFVYDAAESEFHNIRCQDDTIIVANRADLNRYEFIINPDGQGGCYIYDKAISMGTFLGLDGIRFEKAPDKSLVAANGTFITAITDAEIQNEIDKAITL